jgi:eukaryotic-like serine/threonine-protein kinase
MPAVEDFLKLVTESGVLDQDQLAEALKLAPRQGKGDVTAVASYLIDSGRLTRFQLQRLLNGKSSGLRVGGYILLAPLGKSRFSRVYLVRDVKEHRVAALKVLSPQKAKHDRYLARFFHEMEMCQRVTHPHLAAVYEVGMSSGFHFIGMEYIPGRNLFTRVSFDGPLAVADAARYFDQVASVLQHMHTNQLIHRDLKPSNIIITPEDQAKLVDLGLAMVQGQNTLDHRIMGGRGLVVGSMDYLPPEQAENSIAVDPRADVYGLGCTLYFAVTGRPPFPGGTAHQKIKRHSGESAVPASRRNPAISPTFDVLLKRLMAKSPEERLANMTLVREHLRVWFDPQALGTIRSSLASQPTIRAPAEEPLEVRPLPPDSVRVPKAPPARARPGLAALDESPSGASHGMAIGIGIAIGLAVLGFLAVYVLTR